VVIQLRGVQHTLLTRSAHKCVSLLKFMRTSGAVLLGSHGNWQSDGTMFRRKPVDTFGG
jgi:hypothetical protein